MKNPKSYYVIIWLIIPIILLVINLIETVFSFGSLVPFLGMILVGYLLLLPFVLIVMSCFQFVSNEKRKTALLIEILCSVGLYIWFFQFQTELHMGNVFILAGGMYICMIMNLALTFFEQKLKDSKK